MKKREHRSTSKEAHESVKQHKQVFYDKIKDALEKLKVGGNFEEIAKAAGIKPEQCWKRLPEMVELGLVYNVGITRATSSGRKAMVRQLVGLKFKEGELPVIEKPKKSSKHSFPINQEPLFK